MAVAMKIVVDWYVKSCNLVDRPQRLGVLPLSSNWGRRGGGGG